MTHVSFYQLDGAPLDRVLPKLLERSYGSGKTCLVVSPSATRIDYLNDSLWTYDPESFLPHGTSTESNPSTHPILLSTTETDMNKPRYLFLLDGASSQDVTLYERTFVIFDGQQPDLLSHARTLWKAFKMHNYKLDYYTYTADKGWTNTTVS